MIVRLQVGTPARAWQARLADRIREAGHSVVLSQIGGGGSVAATWILVAERWLYGAASAGFASWRLASDGLDGLVDVTLALEGEASGAVLDVLFDGMRGERALVAALLRGRAPLVSVGPPDGSRDVAAGLPAVEDPYVLARSLEQVLVRTEGLALQAVSRFAFGADVGSRPSSPLRRDAGSPLAFVASTLAAKVLARFGLGRGSSTAWRVVHREIGVSASETTAFTALPVHGSRFYADPFPFEWDGLRCVFFEDYDRRTGKGVIACVTIDVAGAVSDPRTVLELPVHLSYPLVFADGDAVYMLPEMSAARRVQLYRAARFPDRWVPDRILLDGIVANDATVICHHGRWWLFATVSGDGGSSWDQLCLFHAPDLIGPWVAHAGNPVLVDAGAARPGGAMWHEGDVLMRVAQDCRIGYGEALAICRVDRLDESGFAQTLVARREPPCGLNATGMHTLNRSATLEVIDLRVGRAQGRRDRASAG